ncbi:MAG: PBECR4 domain-containing protein [Coprobacillus sp.]|nr:PBECR4 domain-containing protein [Coprobacillus sp.]
MCSNFKIQVCNEVIRLSKLFDNYFVKYVYLIASPHFKKQRYYQISASEKNFLHLTGVKTDLDSYTFFIKCLYGILTIDDFDYYPNVENAHTKADIKEKLHNLNKAIGLFSSDVLFFQEGYSKNHINCAFITSEGTFTIGFIDNKGLLFPNTILNRNKTDLDSITSDFVILRKLKGQRQFDTIVYGNQKQINEYCSDFGYLISKQLCC